MAALIVFILWSVPIGILAEYGPLPETGVTLAVALVPLGLAVLADMVVSS